MNNPNSHIKSYLEDYLQPSNESPQFAVLIKGGWGAGKTYFIQEFMSNHDAPEQTLDKENFSNFISISLYGLSSTTDIDDQIFQIMHPILASKELAIASKIAKGLLRFGLKVGNSDVSANPIIPDIKFEKAVKDFKDKILVFDDIERCSIDICELLGYINYFVEHLGLKVILIANEDEIESLIKTQSSENEQNSVEEKKYLQIKEKVIGKTFTISSNHREIITHLITRNKASGDFLYGEIDLCCRVFEIVKNHTDKKHCNYRAFAHTLRDYEYLFKQLSSPFQEMSEEKYSSAMKYFLDYYLRFSYEIQLGELGADIINDVCRIKSEDIINFNRSKRSNNEENRISQFYLRHNITNYSFSRSPLDRNLFKKLLIDCHVNTDEIEGFLKSLPYFASEKDTPLWQRLWSYWTFDNNKYKSIMSEVIDMHKEKTEKDPTSLFHIWGTLIEMKKYEIKLPRFLSNPRQKAFDYIDHLYKNDNLIEHEKLLRNSLRGNGYNIKEKDSNDLQEIIKYFKKRTQQKRINKRLSELQDLRHVLDNNFDFFDENITENYGSEKNDKYCDVPIFRGISPTSFIEFLSSSPDKLGSIRESLFSRYEYFSQSRDENITSVALEEKVFFERVQRILLRKIKPPFSCPNNSTLHNFGTEVIPRFFELISQLQDSK